MQAESCIRLAVYHPACNKLSMLLKIEAEQKFSQNYNPDINKGDIWWKSTGGFVCYEVLISYISWQSLNLFHFRLCSVGFSCSYTERVKIFTITAVDPLFILLSNQLSFFFFFIHISNKSQWLFHWKLVANIFLNWLQNFPKFLTPTYDVHHF